MARHQPPASEAPSLGRVRRHMAILIDFARLAPEAAGLDRLLAIACQHVARATGVHHAKVLRYRPEASDLLTVAGTGWEPGVVGGSLFGADMGSVVGRTLQTRQPLRLADLTEASEFRQEAVLEAHGIRSLVNVPITVGAQVWGVLEVDSTALDSFDADDERFLTAYSLVLGPAVAHREAAEAFLREAEEAGRRLRQADFQMREQGHRVRNYFQMILSILGARSARAEDQRLRQELQDVMERVTAIVLAHDLLDLEGGRGQVNLAAYLDALCSGLERMVSGVEIARELEPVAVAPERAVPAGLIVNELLTNAFKYALPARADAAIAVTLARDAAAGELRLVVRDNGPGMGEERPGGQGLRLVRALAEQLSGACEIEASVAGTRVTVTFPLVE